MGHLFTIYTDNKHLVRFFDPKQATSNTAPARIQRWSLFLSNYDYTVEHKKEIKYSNTDTLYRLPLPTTHSTLEQLAHVKQVQVGQLNASPMNLKQIRIASIKDQILPRGLSLVSRGWPNFCPSDELKPFHLRSTD